MSAFALFRRHGRAEQRPAVIPAQAMACLGTLLHPQS